MLLPQDLTLSVRGSEQCVLSLPLPLLLLRMFLRQQVMLSLPCH